MGEATTAAEQDATFAYEWRDARGNLDFEHMARVLSGRLRQMDKRAAAANRRADQLQQQLRLMQLRAEMAERVRDEARAALNHRKEGERG